MLKMPKAWIEAGTKKSQKSENKVAASTTITARIDMSADVAGKGLCPACKTPMTASHANGHRVMVCMKDRIALPTPDEVE